MPKPILPKRDRAVLAAHEAGMHDAKPKPETCRECAAAALPPAPVEPRKYRVSIARGGDPGTLTVEPITPPPAKPKQSRRCDECGKWYMTTKQYEAHVAKVHAPFFPADKVEAAAVDDAPPVTIAPPKPASIVPVAMPDGGYPTREAWMLAAVDTFRPWFASEGETLPPVRISIGWPGGRGNKQNVLGQCWAAEAVADKVPAIFVSPSQKDPVEVLETILHECIHAAGHMHHRSPFQKVARRFGFVNGGKTKTSREQSPDLYATLDEVAEALGAFPHAAVSGGGGLLGAGDGDKPPVQGTRMIKVYCEGDGYTLRTTRKWLDVAVPSCPVCDGAMTVEEK